MDARRNADKAVMHPDDPATFAAFPIWPFTTVLTHVLDGYVPQRQELKLGKDDLAQCPNEESIRVLLSEVVRIANFMYPHHHVQALILHDAGLTPIPARGLLTTLCQQPPLTRLDLTLNIDLDATSGQLLAKVLPEIPTLRELNLDGCVGMTTTGVEAVALAAATSGTLKILSLTDTVPQTDETRIKHHMKRQYQGRGLVVALYHRMLPENHFGLESHPVQAAKDHLLAQGDPGYLSFYESLHACADLLAEGAIEFL